MVVWTKRQPREPRKKTCSFVRQGVQAAELEAPPVVPRSCSCWRRAGAKSPASLVLWDVQSLASWKRKQAPLQLCSHLAGALIRSLVGRGEEEGETEGSPDIPAEILQRDWTSCCGANEQHGFNASWLRMCLKALHSEDDYICLCFPIFPSLLSISWRAAETSWEARNGYWWLQAAVRSEDGVPAVGHADSQCRQRGFQPGAAQKSNLPKRHLYSPKWKKKRKKWKRKALWSIVAVAFSNAAERSILNVLHRLSIKWNVGQIYIGNSCSMQIWEREDWSCISLVYHSKHFAGEVNATAKWAHPLVLAEEAAAPRCSSDHGCS